MLEGQSIVCFAHDWNGDPTSKTHIMRILARRNRILWINSIGMRRPTASRADFRRMAAKLRRTFQGSVQVEPNLFVGNPLVLPLPGIAAADTLNTYVLSAWIRQLCRRHRLDRPIFWTFLPNVHRLVGRLNERMVIYHCVDEYSAFSNVPREALIQMERSLLRRADIVFTSSAQLCTERRALNPNTHFISHGVDVLHFAQASHPKTLVPEDLRHLPKPIIGFFGLLADWVDLPLIRELALACPDWSFVLIGKATTDLAPVRRLKNVHLLGQKSYAALPAYCRGFDVGIIPFRQNELTVRANPLKLREYLAAGLPVVATPLPEVMRYAPFVRLAEGPHAFATEIEAALGETSDADASRRMDSMRSESWDARVAEIAAVIGAHSGFSGAHHD
jgi:glycosyltransferase involved in cell wall biosynthesis